MILYAALEYVCCFREQFVLGEVYTCAQECVRGHIRLGEELRHKHPGGIWIPLRQRILDLTSERAGRSPGGLCPFCLRPGNWPRRRRS